jgi:hypothetical protein
VKRDFLLRITHLKDVKAMNKLYVLNDCGHGEGEGSCGGGGLLLKYELIAEW